MRDLVVTENITVDGVIDATEGWFLPTGAEEEVDQELLATSKRQRDGADAVLLGRVTYAQFASYWPHQTDDETGVSDYLNQTQKYVVSSTLTDPGWENTTVLSGALAEEVAALKASDGKDIVATGSVQLVRSLVAAGLVDEYRFFVYPVVLGRGTRLFEDATAVGKLRLVEATPLGSGITVFCYRTD